MKTSTSLALLAGLISLAGCANTLLSDDRIRSSTALILGQPESAITISNRRYDGLTNTYYAANTPRGSYQCVINGGSVMALGMTNSPQCTRS